MVAHKQKLIEEIREQIDLSREVSDEEVLGIIDQRIVECSKSTFISLHDKGRLRKELFHAIRRLDILRLAVAGANPAFWNEARNRRAAKRSGDFHGYGGFASAPQTCSQNWRRSPR